MNGFALFGTSHLTALASTALASIALALWLRRRPARIERAGPIVALLLAGSGMGFVVVDALAGTPWRSIAPLHICDVAVFLGVYALISRRQLACELLYYWGCAGTVGALLTPDLGEDFPHYRFVFYFLQHGLIVVSALALTVGARVRPRTRSPLFAWLWLNVYAAAVAAINALFDTNFLYLCNKPGAATPLDWFGPWPWYLLAADVLALTLFVLLGLPFRTFRRPAR